MIALAARDVPAGEERALVALAEQITGDAIAPGKLLAWVITAVEQAASELTVESAGVPLQWSAVVRRWRWCTPESSFEAVVAEAREDAVEASGGAPRAIQTIAMLRARHRFAMVQQDSF